MKRMVFPGGLAEKLREPSGLDPLQIETSLMSSVATRDFGELLHFNPA